ncbi:hypothetical protein BDN71DRAFT_1144497 [Pleurotus eryngii]|uniref:Uncharacterized protein n=1 Tax=Pleurotus eryngii TaxID=5323 RepID=A0A9P6DBK8_PLEER|nr:hypothetical protein BDN71DRAFT_1144497 [Pleurotus eryngii]
MEVETQDYDSDGPRSMVLVWVCFSFSRVCYYLYADGVLCSILVGFRKATRPPEVSSCRSLTGRRATRSFLSYVGSIRPLQLFRKH